MIKAIFFDIDGTLLAKGQDKLDESVVLAINKCKQKGIKIIVSTGRNIAVMQKDVKESLQPDYYITTNGTCINNADGSPIVSYPLDKKTADFFMDLCEKNNWPYAFKFAESMEVYKDFDYFCSQYCNKAIKKEDLIDHTNDKSLSQLPLDCFIYSPNKCALNLDLKGLRVSSAYGDACEWFRDDANKGRMIRELCEILKIDLKDCMAFGDGDNDVEMLEMVGIGVCMANGLPQTKAAADYITDGVNDDGIYNALKHFEII